MELRFVVPIPCLYTQVKVPTWPSGHRSFSKTGNLVEPWKRHILGLSANCPYLKSDPALSRLCAAVNAPQEQELLLATYALLARTIRNRDAHAYVPNVRDDHFSLVPELFARCFNRLVSWLPGGPTTLNCWNAEAQQFIDNS